MPVFFDSIKKELVLLIITGIIGGGIAFGFQWASWKYQRDSDLLEKEMNVATAVFENVSETTDKRIYRMDKLDRWLYENKDQKMIDEQMKEYRKVLYEWNDSYNKNKAKIKLYFGDDISQRFDYIHGFFKDVGKTLESQYYTDPHLRDSKNLDMVVDRIGDLNNMSLEINERMIEKLQKQEVGIFKK